MKLTKFKEKNHKQIGIILFTICCILLVTGVFLYKSFALFTTNEIKNIIKGNVENMGDLYFNFYVNDVLQKDMPNKESRLFLDEEKSYCGISGKKDNNIKVSLTEDYVVQVSGMTSLSTKCNLYFIEKTVSWPQDVIGKIDSLGNGLYEIDHSDYAGENIGFKEKEYRYGGPNPDNYVYFNGEKWRIIGLVNVMTSETKVEQRIKIIRDESIGNYPWDTVNVNDWTKSSLMKLLNGDYYNQLNDFSKNGLNAIARNLIDKHVIWNLGGSDTPIVVLSKYYEFERGTNVYKDDTVTWPTTWNSNNTVEGTIYHSIGLMYPSDYGYATSGGSIGREECYKEPLYYWNGTNDEKYKECGTQSWLKPIHSNYHLLLSSNLLSTSDVFYLGTDFRVGHGLSANLLSAVYPTLYLKSNVQIVSGDGKSVPFKIARVIE